MNIIKKILMVGTLGLAGLITGCADDSERIWEEFKGGIDDYAVRIDDVTYTNHAQRILHLENKEGETPSPFAITGHDYNLDGKWDRIFIRRNFNDGYNGIVIEGRVKSDSEDDDNSKMFTPEQIQYAIKRLDEAVTKVYNSEHLTHKEILGEKK